MTRTKESTDIIARSKVEFESLRVEIVELLENLTPPLTKSSMVAYVQRSENLQSRIAGKIHELTLVIALYSQELAIRKRACKDVVAVTIENKFAANYEMRIGVEGDNVVADLTYVIAILMAYKDTLMEYKWQIKNTEEYYLRLWEKDVI
jgi:predicted transport protein